ncbi:D-alanine--D-alanine ligase, partial [Pseudolycoriella hygida]
MQLPKVKGEYRNNYPLKHLNWFKVGGAAEVFFKPVDLADLVDFLLNSPPNISITVLGAGSNTIIRDGGIEGVVIKLGQNFTNIELMPGNKLAVGSGCLNFNLAKFCQENSIRGLEFLIGIPGTIGGGVTMNAGAYNSEFKDIIVEIEAVNFHGEIITLTNEQIGFKYRGNNLPNNLIITKAIFRAEIGDKEAITTKMNGIINNRQTTQPIKERTGGSTFANPTNYKAWELIDKVGMRGYRIGGAVISELHCNFMINSGDALARDLEDLGELVKSKVLADSGISLKWEIRRIGKYDISLKEFSRFKIAALNNGGKKHVALIGGGLSAEREISLNSSLQVAKALIHNEYKVTFINMGVDISQALLEVQPDMVFNCLHGTYGEDGCLPGLLNILQIPYTHSGVFASSLAFNKAYSKFWFRANNINTAGSMVISKDSNIKNDPMPRPYVIKPLNQGSSIGVVLVLEGDDFNFANYDFPYGDQILIEEYIKGREMQVAVLNGKALGVLEIQLLKRQFYDYDTKYTEGYAKHLCPAPLLPNIYDELLKESEKIYHTMNCQGVARVEFIFDEKQNKSFMLEINTHPGMTPLSIVPEIAALQGMDFNFLVQKSIKKKKINIPLRRKVALIYIRLVFTIKIILIVLLGLFFLTSSFSSIKQEIAQNIYEYAADIGFKLENVLIEGQYNIDEEDILATLNADKGTPIFSLDLSAIKNNLKNNSWVKNIVIIERRLPRTLYIRLIERVPIAIWQFNGQVFLIDEEGHKITSNIGNFSNLLHVVGSDANIYTSKLIEDLSAYPELAAKIISAVRYGERRWDLNLEQNIAVKMPDLHFNQALEYLAKLNKKSILFNQNYKTIDLRDSDKAYITKY